MKKLALIALLSCASALAVFAQIQLTVANGASFKAEPLAPGSYAQVFGDFAGFPTETASAPLPTTLGGVQVVIDGVAAPLYAVDPLKVAFTVPQATTSGRKQLRVTRDGQPVAEGTLDVVAGGPGIFFGFVEVDGTVEPAGGVRAFVSEAEQPYALPETPAQRGGTIIIALTGQGATVENAPADGQAPAGPESPTTELPRVFVSNVEADVSFSGLMPLFPGVWQVNAVVPDESFIQGRVPLVVTYQGRPSNSVVFWVAE